MMSREQMLKFLTEDYESYTSSYTEEDKEAYTLEDDIQTLWDAREDICPTWAEDSYDASRMAGVYLGHISQDEYPLHSPDHRAGL